MLGFRGKVQSLAEFRVRLWLAGIAWVLRPVENVTWVLICNVDEVAQAFYVVPGEFQHGKDDARPIWLITQVGGKNGECLR